MTPRPRLPVFFVLLACAVACLAVSSQSLWIDEAQTALKTLPPTLQGWWHALNTEHTSNMQLPLYMFYIWVWARCFGVSEIALRAANIPWFFLGLFAIFHFLRRHPGLRNASLLIYCLHPFVWAYLNEARPYLMQLSGALLAEGALLTALDETGEGLTSSWWWLFASGLLILCGAGILGVPWAIGIAVFLGCRPAFRQSMLRGGLPSLLVFVPLLTLLAIYFAWTMKEQITSGYLPTSLGSMLAVFYEQLGFMGLGPGRSTLRIASFSALRPFLIPLLLLGVPLAWGLGIAARRRFGLSRARFISIFFLCAIPVCLNLTLGYIRHTRVLGRHLAPLFPFILLAEAYALVLLWKGGRAAGRLATAVIVVCLALSSVEIRFAFRHSKDDYRAAAAAANHALAQGKTVWWAAERNAAAYYHLRVDSRDIPGEARLVDNVPASFTTAPDLIIISKPDLTDPTGGLSAYIAAHHYHAAANWQAFTVWEKPGPASG